MLYVVFTLGFSGNASGKEPTCQCSKHKRLGFDPWVGKIPWRRAWQPIPVFLPRESHVQRSLVGCSPDSKSWTRLKRVSIQYILSSRLPCRFKLATLTPPWVSMLPGPPGTSQLVKIHPSVPPCLSVFFSHHLYSSVYTHTHTHTHTHAPYGLSSCEEPWWTHWDIPSCLAPEAVP